jgi:hypothetical protein
MSLSMSRTRASVLRLRNGITTSPTNRLLGKSLSEDSRPKALFKRICAGEVAVGAEVIVDVSADVDTFRPVAHGS